MDSAARSRIMRSIRKKDTKAELLVKGARVTGTGRDGKFYTRKYMVDLNHNAHPLGGAVEINNQPAHAVPGNNGRGFLQGLVPAGLDTIAFSQDSTHLAAAADRGLLVGPIPASGGQIRLIPTAEPLKPLRAIGVLVAERVLDHYDGGLHGPISSMR